MHCYENMYANFIPYFHFLSILFMCNMTYLNHALIFISSATTDHSSLLAEILV